MICELLILHDLTSLPNQNREGSCREGGIGEDKVSLGHMFFRTPLRPIFLVQQIILTDKLFDLWYIIRILLTPVKLLLKQWMSKVLGL